LETVLIGIGDCTCLSVICELVAYGTVESVSVEKKCGKSWYPAPLRLYHFSINFKNIVIYSFGTYVLKRFGQFWYLKLW
jgi:hypothetical protein